MVTESGRRLDRGAVQRLLTRLAKAAKVKVRRVSPHTLRHAFATLTRDAGARLVSLTASGLGERVYRRAGFTTVDRYRFYQL